MKGRRITSLDGSDSAGGSSRTVFLFELEQLRLQVEVMALKVDEALMRSTQVLLTGDGALADEVVAGDDAIDAMLVSLTEKCYELLIRQNPVASDLRLVMSVLRIVSDFERTGDLCLRVVKLAPEQPLMARHPDTFGILQAMASEASTLFRAAVKAWAAQDLALARSLEEQDDAMDEYNVQLTRAIRRLEGPDAVGAAVATLLAGRALERIADHSVMVGERLRYMLTGDVSGLSREIGP